MSENAHQTEEQPQSSAPDATSSHSPSAAIAPPVSRRRRKALDVHAEYEADRKVRRKASGTPLRDDTARICLHAFLRMLNTWPEDETLKAQRRYVLSICRQAGFDDYEAKRAFEDALDRADVDRRAYIQKKRVEKWRREGCQGPMPSLKPGLRISEVEDRAAIAAAKASLPT